MKKVFTLLFSMIFVFSVVSVCAAVSVEDFSLDEFFETNYLLNIAKNHDALVYETVNTYPEEDMNSKEKTEFIFFEGNIWLDGRVDYADDYSINYAYEREDYPGTLFTVWGDQPDDRSVIMYPTAEYQEIIAQRWLMKDELFPETVQDVQEKDGMIVLTTYATSEGAGFGWTTTYDIDPETGLVKHFVRDYADDDDFHYCLAETTVTYDEPFVPEGEAENIITGGEDLCEVTLVIDPGKDTEEIQKISVSKWTNVSFTNKLFSPMFVDEACTEEVYPIDTSGDSVTVYVDNSREPSWK